MITEDYVSFETAKLLKEKGFDEPCESAYTKEGQYLLSCYNGIAGRRIKNSEALNFSYSVVSPTLQMAMKWLREVYGLFIRITEDMTGNVFEWCVYQKNYGCKASTYVENSYEKACEMAIKYCLNTI